MSAAEDAPSPWLRSHMDALRQAARLGPALDLACGSGRNALPAARAGVRVIGFDRSASDLARFNAAARAEELPACGVRADLESGRGIPVAPESCGAIFVFRFLYRPLADAIVRALRPGGLLLYETFTIHQRNMGKGPSNPAFFLQPGELRGLFPGLETLASEECTIPEPWPQAVARLVARKPAA